MFGNRRRSVEQQQKQLSRAAAAVPLERLEDRTLFAAPSLPDLPNITMPRTSRGADAVYKTFIVPIDASDGDGDALSYKVKAEVSKGVRSKLVTARILARSNPFIRITVSGVTGPDNTPFTDQVMEFELFEDLTPKTVQNIVSLIQSGFYTKTGNDQHSFHRVVKDFMIQGGDPTPLPTRGGSGGPGFSFADEIVPQLAFTSGHGQLAMANSGQDTNGSQFFITHPLKADGTIDYKKNRFLDSKHTIFGHLVSGYETLEKIVNTKVVDNPTGEDSKPVANVLIKSIEVFQNKQDAVLLVTSKVTAANAPKVRITVEASDGESTDVDTFTVNTEAETVNSLPEMGPVPHLYTPLNTPITIPLSAFDLDGDALPLAANPTDDSGATITRDGDKITVIPRQTNDPHTIRFVVGVQRGTGNFGEPVYDTQEITIAVGDKPAFIRLNGVSALSGVARTHNLGTFFDTDTSAQAGDYSVSIKWFVADLTQDTPNEQNDSQVTAGSLVALGNGRFRIEGARTFGTAAQYPFEVPFELTITRESGSVTTTQTGLTATARGLVRVGESNKAAVNGGANVLARVGQVFTQVGSFTRPAADAAGDWVGKVNYGDGAGFRSLGVNPSGMFKLQRKYLTGGLKRITIEFTKGEGATAVVVRHELLARAVAGGPKAVVTGDKTGVSGQVRSFNFRAVDAATTDTSQHRYSINWGDGTATVTTLADMRSLSHRFARPGTFAVTVRAIDPSGVVGPAARFPVKISRAEMQADIARGSGPNIGKGLVIGGTPGADNIRIIVSEDGPQGAVDVLFGNTLAGTFNPGNAAGGSGEVYIYAGGGNDVVNVSPLVGYVFQIYGEEGNDRLTGGPGYNMLIGGAGNDTLAGGSLRDLLVGGLGADKLNGGGDEDILIAGPTSFDANPAITHTMLVEWAQPASSGYDYNTRVGHLSGTITSGAINGSFIYTKKVTGSGARPATIFTDASNDVLTGGDGQDWFIRETSGNTDTVPDMVTTGSAAVEKELDTDPAV